MKKISLLFLCFISIVARLQAQSNVIAVSATEKKLYVLDTTNFNLLNTLTLYTDSADAIVGINGLAKDNSGNIYASIKIASYGNHMLGKINMNTGLITLVDTLIPEKFSNFAYTNNTLFGTTGQGSTTPEALFSINTSSAALTLVDTINQYGISSGYGTALGYCTDNQMLYSWAGDSLYKINPLSGAITMIAYDTTGKLSGDYPQSMLYIGNGNFLVTAYYDNPDFWLCDTLGRISSSGKAYDNSIGNIKGWVYVSQNDYKITGPNSFCANKPGVLYASLVGDSYQWLLNGDSIPGATNTWYTPTVSGVYNCWVNVNGDLDTVAVSKTVTVKNVPVVTLSGDTFVCQNGHIVLTGASGGTLQWYENGVVIPGANANTYTVTGSGVYNQLKTNTNGCSDSANVGITVTEVAPPVTNITSDDNDICIGFSTVIRASGADVYSWSNGATGDTLLVAPTITTSYTVTGTDTITGCSESLSDIISILIPSVTVTPDDFALCTNDSTVLRATGGLSYVWSGGSIDDTLKITPSATTTYTVMGTDVNGCIDTTSYTMIVNGVIPTVFATADDTAICMGSSTMLRSGGTDIITFLWNTTQTDSVISVSPTIQTTYEVIVANGCGADTAWVQVDVNPMPVVTFSLALSNDTVCNTASSFSLTGSPSGGNYTGTGVSGSVYTPSVGVNGWNVITYAYTDGNGCSNSAVDSLYIVNCVGIEESLASDTRFNLFPNPASDFVTVKSSTAIGIVEVFNTLGEIVYTAHTADTTHVIELTQQTPGIYFIRLGVETLKLIKE